MFLIIKDREGEIVMKKRVAVITGASKGIGRSIAITFAQNGYCVVANYNESEDAAKETLAEILKYSDGHIFKADVSSANDVKELFHFIKSTYGVIDILVNNAGKIIRPGNWDTISDDDWDRTYEINAKGTYLCIRELVSLFRDDSVGHIINISSTVGEAGAAAVIAYGAAKASVINMTKSFAAEFAPKITVNAVSPGNIDTEMTTSAGKELVDWVIAATPMKRLGTTQEVADLVAFLGSDHANFITGQVIDIDGGYSWRT